MLVIARDGGLIHLPAAKLRGAAGAMATGVSCRRPTQAPLPALAFPPGAAAFPSPFSCCLPLPPFWLAPPHPLIGVSSRPVFLAAAPAVLPPRAASPRAWPPSCTHDLQGFLGPIFLASSATSVTSASAVTTSSVTYGLFRLSPLTISLRFPPPCGSSTFSLRCFLPHHLVTFATNAQSWHKWLMNRARKS